MLILEKKKDLISNLSFLLKKHNEEIKQKKKTIRTRAEINEIESPILVL